MSLGRCSIFRGAELSILNLLIDKASHIIELQSTPSQASFSSIPLPSLLIAHVLDDDFVRVNLELLHMLVLLEVLIQVYIACFDVALDVYAFPEFLISDD